MFLLKRPKGTKSRRWARGLPHAWREFRHRTNLIRWPACPYGYVNRCGTEQRALLWAYPVWLRVCKRCGFRGWSSHQRSAVSQKRFLLSISSGITYIFTAKGQTRVASKNSNGACPVVVRGVFPCESVLLPGSGVPPGLAGRPNSVLATEEIHGKTGPLPKGAVLFGPFSYAHKKKDVNKIKIVI